MFGFLNIYKPRGLTSFDVVAKLRKVLNIKQIGHTGTLDPFAEGVLPVCIGKATRIIEYLPDDKEYIATVQFGKNTNTYDLEGEVTQIFSKKVTESQITGELSKFRGEIEQVPPIYSALKVNGKKLYEYAREGKAVEIKKRKVFISKIELLEFDEINQVAKILVACSKGTYIRSIAYDLGKYLDCGGYLTELIRTKAGMFDIKNSVRLNDIETKEFAQNVLINPLDVIKNPVYVLNENEHYKVCHGMSIDNNDFNQNEVVFLIYGDKINAIGIVDGCKILTKKVFEI